MEPVRADSDAPSHKLYEGNHSEDSVTFDNGTCPTYEKCQIDFIASTTSNMDSKGEIRKTNGDKFLENTTRPGKKFANQVCTGSLGRWTKQVTNVTRIVSAIESTHVISHL